MIVTLCRCNQGILEQKIGLMNAIINKLGIDNALDVYQNTSPVVKASIGQHYRHSLDHIERATVAANTLIEPSEHTNTTLKDIHIQYDTRERGSQDESDWNAATQRIHRIHYMLEMIQHVQQEQLPNSLSDQIVYANFMLNGDSDQQFPLQSTIGRELGFAAHHAIHHMAMVRTIIVSSNIVPGEEILLLESEIPFNFGKAPSTINFEHTTQ
jgi:hypothetical protein